MDFKFDLSCRRTDVIVVPSAISIFVVFYLTVNAIYLVICCALRYNISSLYIL